MSPPAPTLTWKDVVDLTFVADFDLLRDQYRLPVDSLPDRPWMKPGYREVANRLFKIARAREELKRIYVEAPRLCDWIAFEQRLYCSSIKQLMEQGNAQLALAVQEQWSRREKVNLHHQDVLDELEGLPEFEGVHSDGAKERRAAKAASRARSNARNAVPSTSVDSGSPSNIGIDGGQERELHDKEDDVEAVAIALEDR
jgi:hypothetical protein